MYPIEEILKGCKRNKRKYQKALYDQYAPVLLSICYRYFPEVHKSNDVLQESFISIFKNISKFRNEGSFEGWMKRITVNTALNQLRKDKKFNHVDLDEVHDSVNMQIDDADYVLSIIAELPEKQRQVFNMFGIEGYSAKEVGDIMGMTKENVRVVYHRSRKFLQNKLENYYLTDSR